MSGLAWRSVLGALFVAALFGIYVADTQLFEGHAFATRFLLVGIAILVLREILTLGSRKIETGPGLFVTGLVVVAVLALPHLLLTRTPLPGTLLVVGALAAGGIRLMAMAPLRGVEKAFPEAVLLSVALLYACGPLFFLDRILVEHLKGAYCVVAISKVFDICAYFGGTAVGRKRIAPSLSPKKSWEGTILGFLGGVGAAAALAPHLTPHAMTSGMAAIIGGLIGAATFVGDLIASGLKRWAGVKDSATLVREFGGVLDMVDGVLVAAPVALICLHGG